MNLAKLVFLVGIFMVVTVFYFVWGSGENISQVSSTNAKIIAFGDSLVEGVGSTEGNDFVSVTGRSLGVSIVNKGKRGDTTAMGLARIDEVLAENPGVVILLLGGNDALRRISKKTTFENLGTIIERLQSSGATVVLLGVQGGILGDGYESNYRTLAKKYKTAYVSNILEDIIGRAEYMSDGIHPNDRGYAQIALRVSGVLARMIEK